ncbi:hypothetical protein [Sorangium sp. So ce693]|uniref:hypothetical protein n=1 Tax=Sorangium sp. So ce693 TaxID=3133318 RepID=UPI003F5E722F
MPLLDSVRDEFANRNVLLHLLLGAISVGRRLDAFLPGTPPTPEPPADAPEPPADAPELPADAPELPADAPEPPTDAPEARGLPPSDGAQRVTSARDRRGAGDQLLYLVLGAISLRRALMAEIEPLRAAHAEAARRDAAGAQEPAVQAAKLRDLLR